MPTFNKYKGNIVSVQFTPKEQKAFDKELTRQIIDGHRQTEIDDTATILWILHSEFGFGRDRLKKVFDLIYQQNKDYETHYLLDKEGGCWISRRNLKEYGVDVEEWFRKAVKNEK